MLDHAETFLRECAPFSFLPEAELAPVARALTLEYQPRGQLLFVQGQSVFESVYLIQQGALEVFDEQEGEESHRDLLGRYEHCGGVAILHNDGVALRNVRTAEDTFFYCLPRQQFLELCAEHADLRAYMTDLFGERMLDRSQALLRSKRLQSMTRREALLCSLTAGQISSPEVLFCGPSTPIREAARLMRDQQQDALLVRERDEGVAAGIVTDQDLRCKVLAAGLDPAEPVSSIMSSPVRTAPDSASAMAAVMTMLEHRIKHLVVVDGDGEISGLLSDQHLLLAQGRSPLQLLRQIRQTQLLRDLNRIRPMVPRLIRGLSVEGVPVESLTRMITRITDATLQRVLELIQAELGPAPCRFAWLCLGSEGRREQTLATDQDNALIYEDVPAAQQEEVEAYFQRLASQACTALDAAGHPYCPGEVMARNARWCQPLSGWRATFRGWIRTPEPQAVMQSSIFFDLRCGYGEQELVDALRADLQEQLADRAGLFFYHLALNACRNPPPLGFLRQFVVTDRGDQHQVLDIKKPIMAIVDVARIYALRHGLGETNTLDRLRELGRQALIKPADAEETEQAYTWLMELRFERQEAAVLEEGRTADNAIQPHRLSGMEQRILKEAFRLVERLQLKLKLDFTGSS